MNAVSSEPIVVIIGLYVALYLLPSNAEIAARFRHWKARRIRL